MSRLTTRQVLSPSRSLLVCWVTRPICIWLVPRPGQLVHLEEMQRPEGGIVLAGADYAILDPSTINGAIEGGLTSAFAS